MAEPEAEPAAAEPPRSFPEDTVEYILLQEALEYQGWLEQEREKLKKELDDVDKKITKTAREQSYHYRQYATKMQAWDVYKGITKTVKKQLKKTKDIADIEPMAPIPLTKVTKTETDGEQPQQLLEI